MATKGSLWVRTGNTSDLNDYQVLGGFIECCADSSRNIKYQPNVTRSHPLECRDTNARAATEIEIYAYKHGAKNIKDFSVTAPNNFAFLVSNDTHFEEYTHACKEFGIPRVRLEKDWKGILFLGIYDNKSKEWSGWDNAHTNIMDSKIWNSNVPLMEKFLDEFVNIKASVRKVPDAPTKQKVTIRYMPGDVIYAVSPNGNYQYILTVTDQFDHIAGDKIRIPYFGGFIAIHSDKYHPSDTHGTISTIRGANAEEKKWLAACKHDGAFTSKPTLPIRAEHINSAFKKGDVVVVNESEGCSGYSYLATLSEDCDDSACWIKGYIDMANTVYRDDTGAASVKAIRKATDTEVGWLSSCKAAGKMVDKVEPKIFKKGTWVQMKSVSGSHEYILELSKDINPYVDEVYSKPGFISVNSSTFGQALGSFMIYPAMRHVTNEERKWLILCRDKGRYMPNPATKTTPVEPEPAPKPAPEMQDIIRKGDYVHVDTGACTYLTIARDDHHHGVFFWGSKSGYIDIQNNIFHLSGSNFGINNKIRFATVEEENWLRRSINAGCTTSKALTQEGLCVVRTNSTEGDTRYSKGFIFIAKEGREGCNAYYQSSGRIVPSNFRYATMKEREWHKKDPINNTNIVKMIVAKVKEMTKESLENKYANEALTENVYYRHGNDIICWKQGLIPCLDLTNLSWYKNMSAFSTCRADTFILATPKEIAWYKACEAEGTFVSDPTRMKFLEGDIVVRTKDAISPNRHGQFKGDMFKCIRTTVNGKNAAYDNGMSTRNARLATESEIEGFNSGFTTTENIPVPKMGEGVREQMQEHPKTPKEAFKAPEVKGHLSHLNERLARDSQTWGVDINTTNPLLLEAYKKYPPGTVYYPAHLSYNGPQDDKYNCVVDPDTKFYGTGSVHQSSGNNIKNGHDYSECIKSCDGKWARIVPTPLKGSKEHLDGGLMPVGIGEMFNSNIEKIVEDFSDDCGKVSVEAVSLEPKKNIMKVDLLPYKKRT